MLFCRAENDAASGGELPEAALTAYPLAKRIGGGAHFDLRGMMAAGTPNLSGRHHAPTQPTDAASGQVTMRPAARRRKFD
jgi:hypothetical protein